MTAGATVARIAALVIAVSALSMAAGPAPASAGVGNAVCGAAGLLSGLAGKACTVIEHGKQLIGVGKKLATGHFGSAAKSLLGGGGASSSSSTSTAIGLAAIGAWVFGGAKFALHETAKVLGETTSPQLTSTWFSSAYWRIAGIAAVLTLPFLFAAAVQALVRSDLALLTRAVFGYLPLAFLAVSIAAPVAMLLLAASDEMSAVIARAGGSGGAHFLALAGATAGLLSLLHGSPFLAFLVGLFTVAGAIVLWLELLAREAAVYVIVLMLPLAFASLVWPARRKWAIRAVELLVALILSKFAIVAVLSLGGAALGHGDGGGVARMLAGFVLVTLGAFAPWALLRLLPLAELASSAAGSLRAEARTAGMHLDVAGARADYAGDWAALVAARLRTPPDESTPAEHPVVGGDGAAAAEAQRLGELEAGPGGGDGDLGGRAGGADPPPGEDGPLDGGPMDGGPLDGGGPAGAGGLDSDDASGSDDSFADGESPGGRAVPAGGLSGAGDDAGGAGSDLGPLIAPGVRWRTLRLGLDEDWQNPEPLLPPRTAGAGGAGQGTSDPSTREDHDPRPPAQEPEDGSL